MASGDIVPPAPPDPEYWLRVGQGADAALALTRASTIEERLALLRQFPILVLSEFLGALMASAVQHPDPRRRMLLVEGTRQLLAMEGALAESAAPQFAILTLACGLTLLHEGNGSLETNLHAAIGCFTRAAQLFSPGPEQAECFLSEAMAIGRLAEVGAAGPVDLQRALVAISAANALFDSRRDTARCRLNEGNIRQHLANTSSSEARAHLHAAIALYREARALLGFDPLSAGCVMNEANAAAALARLGEDSAAHLLEAISLYGLAETSMGGAEQRAWCRINQGAAHAMLADLGVESVDHARAAIDLFRHALLDARGSYMSGRCLAGEANARETLAAAGHDPRANLSEAVRLIQSIRDEGDTPAVRASLLANEALLRDKLAEQGVEERTNRDEAIRLFGEARRLRGGKADPEDAINEANSLRDLAGFSRTVHVRLKASLLRQAIARYREARYASADADLRASTLLNEGNTLWRLAHLGIEPELNLRQAAQLAAGARQEQPDGIRLARSLALEGTVWSSLVESGAGSETDVETALSLLQRAAESFAALGFTASEMLAHWQRGRMLRGEQRWDEAYQALAAAITALERVRGTITRTTDRTAWMERTNAIFRDMVESCLTLDRPGDALGYAERGRSRALVDLLSLHDLTPRNVRPEMAEAYRRLRRRLEELEGLLGAEEGRDGDARGWDGGRAGRGSGAVDRSARLDVLLDERSALTVRLQQLELDVRRDDPDFLAAAAPMSLMDMQALAEQLQRPLVLPWIGEARSLAFAIQPGRDLEEIDLPGVTAETVRSWLLGPRSALTPEGWLGDYVRDRERWRTNMDSVLFLLYDQLMAPIHRWSRRASVDHIAVIVGGALGLLPLHAAAWRGPDGRVHHLLEELSIGYAPSATVLQRCVSRPRAAWTPVLVVGDPTTDSAQRLEVAQWEAAFIEQTMKRRHGRGSVVRVGGEEATAVRIRELLPDHPVAHFACHGIWERERPLESALMLAGSDRLTLGGLIAEINLDRAQLAVLSACESAAGADPGSSAEEYLGLPAGFMVAGAQAVVGSLWAVEDEATGLLISHFYGLLMDGYEVPEALREAQVWLRDLGPDEAEGILGWRYAGTLAARGARPFSHPASWAAFTALGSPVRLG